MDPSLKPDPLRKGSYYRRLEDVGRGLESLRVNELSAPMRFFADYFGCEKVARGITGIHARLPASDAYSHRKSIILAKVQAAATALALPVSADTLDWLFAGWDEQSFLNPPAPGISHSARFLRNTVTHDFGPSHIAEVVAHAPFLNPKLQSFLACVPAVLQYQQRHFANIP